MADDAETVLAWCFDKLATGTAGPLVGSRIYRIGEVPQSDTWPGNIIVIQAYTEAPVYVQGPRRSSNLVSLQVDVLGRDVASEDLSPTVAAVDADLDTKHEYLVANTAKVVCLRKPGGLPYDVDRDDPRIKRRTVDYWAHLQPSIG